MRRFKQEITDTNILEEILSSSEICRLGFVDNDRAYVLPFNYGYKDNCIYIHCANTGKKIDLIKKNNLVCFEIEFMHRIEKYDKACKWTTTYRSIVGYGTVEIITDEKGKRNGLDILMKQHGADDTVDMNYEDHHLERMSVLKVSITEMSGKESSNWKVTH